MEEPRPSVTAAVVAATLLLVRDDPALARFVDRAAVEAVARSIREPLPGVGWALDHVPWPVLRRAALLLERVVSPGFSRHYVLRKHLIRTHLLEAIEAGHRQVVLVGAGFDMLSASLPHHVRAFEVDLPATQEAKRRAVEGQTPPCSLSYVPVDLEREDLVDALRASPGFDRRADTVFAAEGLLMYLEPKRVESLLGGLRKLEGRVRLVASIVTPDAHGRVRLHTQRGVVDLCMRLLGERFRWGLGVKELERMLGGLGMRLEAARWPADLAGIDPADRRALARIGEVVVVAAADARRAVAASSSAAE